MAHKQPGYRFENDWEPEMSVSDAKYVAAGIALPIYEEIKLNNTVLNLESVKRYLEKARKIAIIGCPCRTKRHHCDAPRVACGRHAPIGSLPWTIRVATRVWLSLA